MYKVSQQDNLSPGGNITSVVAGADTRMVGFLTAYVTVGVMKDSVIKVSDFLKVHACIPHGLVLSLECGKRRRNG